MAEEIRIFELKMELDLLASKIKECITEFFPLHANIKGNIYIVADDVEISLPLSEQLQLPSKPLPYKELGGYYDQVKDQLPNFNSPKRYTNFNQFFTESCCMLKTVDIRSPKTGISVHYSYSLLMAMQIY